MTVAPDETTEGWFLYMIEQASGQLYTGITRDVARRFAEHQSNSSRTARALRGKGPLKLVFHTPAGNHSQALKLELQIKKLQRYKKLQIVTGKIDISSLHSLSSWAKSS